MTNTAQGTARPTTRSISVRTRRSTMAAGWHPATPSAAAASPRARCPRWWGRRCEPAWSVPPPACAPGCQPRMPRRPRPPAPPGSLVKSHRPWRRFGSWWRRQVAAAQARMISKAARGAASGTIMAGSSTKHAVARVALRHAGRLAGGGAGIGATRRCASSSLRMRRIEARMSSIEGSPSRPAWQAGGDPGDASGDALIAISQRPGWSVA